MDMFNFFTTQLAYAVISLCVPFVVTITLILFILSFSNSYNLSDSNMYKIDLLVILLLIAFAVLHLSTVQIGAL